MEIDNCIHISTVELRENISEKLNLVGFGNKNLIIDRRKKPLAALIPIAEYEEFIAFKQQEQDQWK